MAAIYPDINAGSSLLAARGSAVAEMARAQNQSSENFVKAIQGIGENLQKWQEGIDKRKDAKEEKEFRAKTFAEQQRTNRERENIDKKRIALEEDLLPAKQKLMKSQAWETNTRAGLNAQQKKWGDDFKKREDDYNAKLKAENEAKLKEAEAKANQADITPINEAKPAQQGLFSKLKSDFINGVTGHAQAKRK